LILIVASFMIDTTTDIKNSEQLNTNAVSNTLTFKDDCLNREPFAKKLTQAITTFYAFEDDAYVLSLNASFGSGKTTFVHMWKNYLEDQAIQCVYLNAWEQDFDDEPLMPILEALLGKLPDDKQGIRNKIYAAVSVVGASIAKQFIANTTGMSVSGLVTEVKDKIKDKNALEEGKKVFETYQFKRKALEDLRVALGDYVKTLDGKPLVIFVDELDRARPNYSVRFLETIKHVFSIQGICFVLSVDRDQLKQSVVHQYGNIDFDNYYLRLVTAEADLPDAGIDDLTKFIKSVDDRYKYSGTNEKLKNFFKGNKMCAEICKSFELKPRQIQRLYRVLAMYLAVPKDHKIDGYNKERQAPTLLIAIQIKYPELYQKIGEGSVDKKEDIDELITKIKTRDRYFVRKFFRSLANKSNKETIRAIAKTVVSESEFTDYYSGTWFETNLETKSRFQQIYQQLESWDSFLN
jgi:hypothetical protein